MCRRRVATLLAAAVAVSLLAAPACAQDPNLGEFKDVPEDLVSAIRLVNTEYYTDPSQIEIIVQCEPNKGELSTVFEPDEASPGTLLFRPYAGAQGQDFFTFTVEGPLIDGLSPEKISELQGTKVARLNILRTNDPPLPPEDNRFEIQVAPGVATEGKMRRGCYNRPQGGLNAFNICLREFPENLDAVLPMEVDLDRDPLRFIVQKQPKKGTFVRIDQDSGLFSYQPNDGVTAEWDSFTYIITDCPPSCEPGEGNCPNKDPPDCAETLEVEVSVRIGDPTGMRAKSKTYNMWEDNVLQDGWIDPTTGQIMVDSKVELERSTFQEAGWSSTDAESTVLKWWIVEPPRFGTVLVLGCNDTDTSACQDEKIPFIYTPDRNYFGLDNFTYRVEDRNAPRPNADLDGTITINIAGTPDPPVAVGGEIDVPMARLELLEVQNAEKIVLRSEEYDGQADEMWMIMTSTMVNGTLYESLVDADGNEVDDPSLAVGFGPEIVTGNYYNMTKAEIQDLEFGTVFEKTVYYMPKRLTRGKPLDSIRWATMSGRERASACSTRVGWVILPQASCTSSKQIPPSALADVSLIVQCAKGYAVSSADPTRCLACSDGSYAPGLDLPSCTPCEKGRFSNSEVGHEECTRCEVNSYSDKEGSSSCKSCPLNIDDPFEKTSITLGKGKTSIYDCICERKNTKNSIEEDRGYYGVPGGQCRPCPAEGSRCMDNNMTWPVNTEGWFLDLDFDDHVADPMPCNHNAACPANDDWEMMRWKPCADGYNGTRCAECWSRCNSATADQGFYCYPEEDPRHEWWNPPRGQYFRYDKECRECPKINGIGLILGALLGFFLLSPLIIKASDAVKSLPSVNIGLSFSQILAIFPSFNIDWPASMTWLWEKLSFFNLNLQLLAPECVIEWKWIYTYIITISTPVVIFFVLILAILLRLIHTAFARSVGAWLRSAFPFRECKSMDPTCNYHNHCEDCKARPAHERPNPGIAGPPCGKGQTYWFSKKRYQLGMFLTKSARKDQYVEMVKSEVRIFLTFLKVGYIFLASATLGYFDCVGNAALGSGRYLDADPTLECSFDLEEGQPDTWPKLFPLAVFVLLLYPVGIMALFGGLLYRARKALDSKGTKSILGILYIRYKPQYFYWELNILARKLVIVMCGILFSAETEANGLRQLLFGMLVLLVALLTHMYAYPFDRRNLNHLESATISAQFFSLFVGLAFLSNKMSKGFSRFMEICNLIVMAISFFACGYFILLDIFPDFRSKYAEFWEKRQEKKLRKIREKERQNAGDDMSIVGYKKVMEFRWRTTLGATASKLLTATGARILCEFIDSDQSLDDIINEGRPDDKKIPLPTDENGKVLTKKEAVRKCFEDLSNFVHDEDHLHMKEERQYIYEYFRPNVRNVILEGLSREDKETTDRLKAFLQMVVEGSDDDNNKRGILGGILTGARGSMGGKVNPRSSASSSKKSNADDSHSVKVDPDSDSSDDEEGVAAIAPADASKPLLD